MKTILAVVGTALIIPAIIVLVTLIMPLVGAFTGAVFGFFFPGTAAAVLAWLGLSNIAFWQFGAALAFIGGFFRASISK